MRSLLLGLGFASAFLISIVVHGFLTAWLADRMGDRTPRMMRRVSLSIKNHMDPLGTFIVPGIFTAGAIFGNPYLPLFGWGKRHVLDTRGLRKPRRDTIVVALAGPVTTLCLGSIAGVIYRVTAGFSVSGIFARQDSLVASFAGGFALVCAFLTVIELLPMPGRDGGRILARFLSPSAAAKMEELVQYDALFLLAIFMLERILGGTVLGMANPVCRLLTGVTCRALLV